MGAVHKACPCRRDLITKKKKNIKVNFQELYYSIKVLQEIMYNKRCFYSLVSHINGSQFSIYTRKQKKKAEIRKVVSTLNMTINSYQLYKIFSKYKNCYSNKSFNISAISERSFITGYKIRNLHSKNLLTLTQIYCYMHQYQYILICITEKTF